MVAEVASAGSWAWWRRAAASTPASVAGLEQGRVFSGREALAYKLVDQIGGEAEAVKWLEEKRSIPKGLKVVDWKPKRESSWGLLGLSARRRSAQLFGDRAGRRDCRPRRRRRRARQIAP